MYRIESKIVEKLKEEGLNATDFLRKHAKERKSETERRVVYYEITDELLAELKVIGIDAERDVIAAIQHAASNIGSEVKILRKWSNLKRIP